MSFRISAVWRNIDLTGVPPALAARSSHNLVIVGGRALIFGGEQKPRQPIGEEVVEVSLDGSSTPRILSSKSTAQWPRPRVGAAACTSPSLPGRALMLGGRGGKAMMPFAIPDAEEAEGLWTFDPAREEWELLPTEGEAPEGRSYHTMTSIGETVYVHAGCPTSGRLGTLHALDLRTKTWTTLPDAPGNPRGGTVLATIRGSDGKDVLARWGGFCGYELGGPLDVFDPATGSWTSHDVCIQGTDKVEPPKRSVHAFVPFRTTASSPSKLDGKDVVAVLAMGEGEGAPAHLGHDGAGKFLDDVYLLLRSGTADYSWLPVKPQRPDGAPTPRGWLAFDVVPVDEKSCSLVVHGGLQESNERLSDAWRLDFRIG